MRLRHRVEAGRSAHLPSLGHGCSPDHLLIQTHGRYKVSACPEILPREVPGLAHEPPCDRDRALALDESDYVRYRILGRNTQAYMHMVGHQISLHNLALLLLGQIMKNLSKALPYRPENRLLATLRNEDYVILAVPPCVGEALVRSHRLLLALGRAAENQSHRTSRSNPV